MKTRNLAAKRSLKFILAIACVNLFTFTYAPGANAQSKEVTKVSFTKDKFNRIFLPAKINKDTVAVLFGTYSPTLRLSPYFAEEWELYPGWGGVTETSKIGRRQNRMLFYLPQMQIGNIKFRNEETILNHAFPDSIATGSTGTLLVYQYNWRIDNDRNEVSISKEPFESANAQTYTTIKYKNTTPPLAAVEIAEAKADFIIDLGSGANFQVNTGSDLGKKLIETYRLKPVNTITSNLHSRKTIDTIYEVTVPSLTFNGKELKNQKVTISSASPQNIIGTGFLGNYNVILNNSKKKKIESSMILEKRLVD